VEVCLQVFIYRLNAFCLVCFAAAFLLPTQTQLMAQQREFAPRVDGHQTPLMVYHAAGSEHGCAPVAVISHGAGGSENGYRYLAEAMSQMGYMAIVMGHRESGGAALRADILSNGIKRGVRKLVSSRQAEETRLLDVGAALDWASGRCHAPYRVLLGHSMGSETVMLEAGAQNIIGVSSPPAGQDRFDAYVALSPEGPGIVFPDHAWSKIRKPMLVLTGTRDRALQGGPQSRQVPWRELPGTGGAGCQWMGVIHNATHMNFAGIGIGAHGVDSLITQTIAAFLTGARKGKCTLSSPAAEMTLDSK
jgi:predicted dienelactone hydrolase